MKDGFDGNGTGGVDGAARLAWEMFEKTGSISYYMLYYDILRKK